MCAPCLLIHRIVRPAAQDTSDAFHGHASQKISLGKGGTLAGLSNRGLGNEGLVFHAGKDYTGYFFAKSGRSSGPSSRSGPTTPVTVTVALRDVYATFLTAMDPLSTTFPISMG